MDFTGTAHRMKKYIHKNGKPLSLKTETVTGGDEWNPTTTTETKSIIGIQSTFQKGEIDGSIIQNNDKKYIVSNEYEISTTDKLIDGTTEFSIINADPVAPGGTTILYIVQARA